MSTPNYPPDFNLEAVSETYDEILLNRATTKGRDYAVALNQCINTTAKTTLIRKNLTDPKLSAMANEVNASAVVGICNFFGVDQDEILSDLSLLFNATARAAKTPKEGD